MSHRQGEGGGKGFSCETQRVSFNFPSPVQTNRPVTSATATSTRKTRALDELAGKKAAHTRCRLSTFPRESACARCFLARCANNRVRKSKTKEKKWQPLMQHDRKSKDCAQTWMARCSTRGQNGCIPRMRSRYRPWSHVS